MKISASSLLLQLLLAADVGFFVMHLVWLALPSPGHAFFSLSTDLGYGEWFQYLKTFWMVIILVVLFQRTRHIFYLAWSFFWVYIPLDDALQIHERVGVWIAESVPFLSGVRDAKDVGELIVYAVVGTLLILLLITAYYRTPRNQRGDSLGLTFFAGLFLFFSVVLDILGGLVSAFLPSRLLLYGFNFLEDGGEMIVLSFAVSWLFARLVTEPFLPARWITPLQRFAQLRNNLGSKG